MNPALALLVIVWSGHNIQPQAVELTECNRAVEAIKTAVHVREERYAFQPDVTSYCIPLNTAADQTVYALLEPPEPSPSPVSVPAPIRQEPNH